MKRKHCTVVEHDLFKRMTIMTATITEATTVISLQALVAVIENQKINKMKAKREEQ